MRAWIGCLASYNNGHLHGEWFDVSTDADENAANIAKVLASSKEPGAEEWFIADYDGPAALTRDLGENPGLEVLAKAAEIEEAVFDRFPDDSDAAAVLGVMLDGYRIADIDDADEWMSDRYAGQADTLADFAADLIEESGLLKDVPDELARYFDYESYGRDLELGGDISTERGASQLLVFWNR